MEKTGESLNRHKSEQSVGTPRELLDAVERRWGRLQFDLAADANNAVAFNFFSKEDDALRQSWAGRGLCWLNPPFDDIPRFAARCKAEARRGARIIMLTPAAVSTNWYAAHVQGHALVYPIKRCRFVGHDADFPKDLMLSLYGWGISGWGHFWNWKETA